MNRALFNVIIILLHRPFVADGHLHSTARSISVNAFVACANAATTIVKILRVYDLAFSVQRAPYLISYATYVASTVHTRIAAKRGMGSDAHKSLETCLAVFRENQETNYAVRRADAIVRNLIKRFGVTVSATQDLRIHSQADGANSSSPEVQGSDPSSPNDPLFRNLDIDGVIQSFAREQDVAENMTNVAMEQTGSLTSLMRENYPVFPDTTHPANVPYAEAMRGFSVQHGSYWPNAGALEHQDDPTITVDDLLYGFNGDILDSFLGADWSTT